MAHRKRWPDTRRMPVVSENQWKPMKLFAKVKREVQREREVKFEIRYFLMVKPLGDIVANWYVGKEAKWFHGDPMNDFVAWEEIIRPHDEALEII